MADQKVVVDQLCLIVGITTDALLKGESLSATDVGIFLTKEKVNIVKLSQQQQLLCAAATVDLSINGYKAAKEYVDTFKDTRTAATIGSLAGPEGTVLFGGIAAASHLPDLIDKSSKAINSALDVHSQCGPLVFDKATKPRMTPMVTEVGMTPADPDLQYTPYDPSRKMSMP